MSVPAPQDPQRPRAISFQNPWYHKAILFFIMGIIILSFLISAGTTWFSDSPSPETKALISQSWTMGERAFFALVGYFVGRSL